jgi:hypothetical protein
MSSPSPQTTRVAFNTLGRPLINEYRSTLAVMTEAAWNDPTTPQVILAELLFRSRVKARTLRTKISERLVELSKESFLWPSTAVLPSSRALSGDQFWYSEGILSFMGYRVGYNGVPASNRRDILDYVYHEAVPRVNSSVYMTSWGSPKSSRRLQKMAESLAAFARNAKRNLFADMSMAIDDWETDLDYLECTIYEGRYDFKWPVVE